MLTYLRRDERKPKAWGRLASMFKSGPSFIEDYGFPADATERRLNRRIFTYWESKCPSASFPAPEAIDGRELGADWDWCFVLDTRANYGFARFDYLGAELVKFSGVFLSGRYDWTCTVLDKATEQVGRVLRGLGPVLCDEDLKLFDGRRLLFRSVLLPLSADGRSITHLLGAANGKLTDA